MAPNLSVILCIFSLLQLLFAAANGAGHHHAAPAPSVDCSSLVLNMADCLSFVSNGSTTTKPEGSCCSGLKTVLKTDAECLCEAFKSSAQFGVVLNVTKAATLPVACKIHAPSISNCKLSLAPAAAPGIGLAPSAGGAAVAPTVSSGASVQAPAPSPTQGNSGSGGLSMSIGALVIGFVIASFSSF